MLEPQTFFYDLISRDPFPQTSVFELLHKILSVNFTNEVDDYVVFLLQSLVIGAEVI
jgi:hypothetical protein